MSVSHTKYRKLISRLKTKRLLLLLALVIGLIPVSQIMTVHAGALTPIQHVVIIYQENHSFDNVLGQLCATESRSVPCDGATTGITETGSSVPLQTSPDIVPNADHSDKAQQVAINNGKMDSFDKINNCAWNQFAPPSGDVAPYSDCYTQFTPAQIPSLAALARKYAISDRTFESNKVPSWGGHLELALAGLGGFNGDNPQVDSTVTTYPGWGCDSNRKALWSPDGGITPYTFQPSCIPYPSLDSTRFPYGGAYKPSSVAWQPTLMDRAQSAGVSMHIYATLPTSTTPSPQVTAPSATPAPFAAGQNNPGGYSWSICPSFADCLYTSQRNAVMAKTTQLDTDAINGTLPAISLVMPSSATGTTSQHNNTSMMTGDNRISQIVSEIQNGPNWANTAIFITYDDCGCFSDHVAPPTPSLGIRVPMVLVSPYAKANFTDHSTASYFSMLAYIEHNFGLQPLNNNDASAYDYNGAFDYTQTPLTKTNLTQHSVPAASTQFMQAHPGIGDGDPT